MDNFHWKGKQCSGPEVRPRQKISILFWHTTEWQKLNEGGSKLVDSISLYPETLLAQICLPISGRWSPESICHVQSKQTDPIKFPLYWTFHKVESEYNLNPSKTELHQGKKIPFNSCVAHSLGHTQVHTRQKHWMQPQSQLLDPKVSKLRLKSNDLPRHRSLM